MPGPLFPYWVTYQFGDRHTPPPHGVTWAHQIHSSIVLKDPGHAGRIGDGDAIVSNRPGALIGVRTADCVPILMADPGRRAVAAVHAGWRGTVSDVAGAAVRTLHSEFGSAPADLLITIGPAIGPCCFEVGPEVASEFAAIFPERTGLDCRTHIDLPEANRRLLLRAGVRPEHIDPPGTPGCTKCHPERYHSWRRDRDKSARMWAVIGIRPTAP